MLAGCTPAFLMEIPPSSTAANSTPAAVQLTSTVLSLSPVGLAAPGRPVDLQLRISLPRTGRDLPIVLLSHGHGSSNYLSSLEGYAPLANYWAARGFVVIQPTHLSSKTLRQDPRLASAPGAPFFWRSRPQDMSYILDQLDALEAAVPELTGRLDHSRVAVAGHSLGAHTASMLLGAQLTDEDGIKVSLVEPRIKAGILLTPPGNGDLTAAGAERVPFFRYPSFAEMTTPTLVVIGEEDVAAHFTARGADWHADPYFLSPGPKCLLTVLGSGHLLGGISGYDAAETTDENPERVAFVQHLTWAYLRTALYPEDPAWAEACAHLQQASPALGQVVCK